MVLKQINTWRRGHWAIVIAQWLAHVSISGRYPHFAAIRWLADMLSTDSVTLRAGFGGVNASVAVSGMR
jgi:hypothetical protein